MYATMEGHERFRLRQLPFMQEAERVGGVSQANLRVRPPATDASYYTRWCLWGSPDTIAKKMQTLADVGLGNVLLSFNNGLYDDERRKLTEKSMQLFVREVMPRFTCRRRRAIRWRSTSAAHGDQRSQADDGTRRIRLKNFSGQNNSLSPRKREKQIVLSSRTNPTRSLLRHTAAIAAGRVPGRYTCARFRRPVSCHAARQGGWPPHSAPAHRDRSCRRVPSPPALSTVPPRCVRIRRRAVRS